MTVKNRIKIISIATQPHGTLLRENRDAADRLVAGIAADVGVDADCVTTFGVEVSVTLLAGAL